MRLGGTMYLGFIYSSNKTITSLYKVFWHEGLQGWTRHGVLPSCNCHPGDSPRLLCGGQAVGVEKRNKDQLGCLYWPNVRWWWLRSGRAGGEKRLAKYLHNECFWKSNHESPSAHPLLCSSVTDLAHFILLMKESLIKSPFLAGLESVSTDNTNQLIPGQQWPTLKVWVWTQGWLLSSGNPLSHVKTMLCEKYCRACPRAILNLASRAPTELPVNQPFSVLLIFLHLHKMWNTWMDRLFYQLSIRPLRSEYLYS